LSHGWRIDVGGSGNFVVE